LGRLVKKGGVAMLIVGGSGHGETGERKGKPDELLLSSTI
jgi:hypothetical protein